MSWELDLELGERREVWTFLVDDDWTYKSWAKLNYPRNASTNQISWEY